MRQDPMKMQTANKDTIPCRNCIYRDKAFVIIDGEKLETGITKDTCLIFDGKKGNWKPNNVYFHSEMCVFYERDDQA